MQVQKPEKRVETEGAAPLAWRCFHCDEVFTTVDAATDHFGPAIYSDPACTIDAHRLRELEAELARYREEDTDLHREIHRLHSEHGQALRREEEKGYARGLADANASRVFLTELVTAKWGVRHLWQLTEHAVLKPGIDPRLNGAYNRALAHLRGSLVAPLPHDHSPV